ncbi:hypothetical protein EVAR_51809_1 [Eumeta japonica]|uniref:Uncharacterized protein n=1 Tax=Eumeta variegata TaxID=151549 RepID=A0A4C1XYX1_EUMVA|nr:hypothetical protein EVAR_51809_1 [Eumeta japonica]
MRGRDMELSRAAYSSRSRKLSHLRYTHEIHRLSPTIMRDLVEIASQQPRGRDCWSPETAIFFIIVLDDLCTVPQRSHWRNKLYGHVPSNLTYAVHMFRQIHYL